MTAVALTPQRESAHVPGRRIYHAALLHAANPWGTLVLPWLIYSAIFAMTYAIWRLIANAAGGVENLEPHAFSYNGGAFWGVVYMMVVAVQAMNLTFRFAMGISLTRREYYLGTAAYFAFLAVVYGTGLTIGAAVERATDGWGVGGAFFNPWFMDSAPLWQVWLSWISLFLFFIFLGAAVATVYVRWGSNGLIAFFIALAALLVGAGWIAVTLELGPHIEKWLAQTSLMEMAGFTVLASAVAGVIGYFLLRKATPRA